MCRYTLVDHKNIIDSDGFITDYTWYYDEVECVHLFIYGDSDLYTPEEDTPDFECDRYREAKEWFDCYE